jgi:nitrogen fixation protein NifQ
MKAVMTEALSRTDPPSSDPGRLYVWLMAPVAPGDFHRHILASVLALAATQPNTSLSQATGLGWDELARLIAAEFPHAEALLDGASPDTDGAEPLTIEEPDLRGLLLSHASPLDAGLTADRLGWMARIVARRAQCPNHLWQDLGLPERKHLSRLMRDYFGPLAQANDRDMKWKKFFYRQMCEDEGMTLCKSPVCDSCDDFTECFGDEDGHALLAQNARSAKDQSEG